MIAYETIEGGLVTRQGLDPWRPRRGRRAQTARRDGVAADRGAARHRDGRLLAAQTELVEVVHVLKACVCVKG